MRARGAGDGDGRHCWRAVEAGEAHGRRNRTPRGVPRAPCRGPSCVGGDGRGGCAAREESATQTIVRVEAGSIVVEADLANYTPEVKRESKKARRARQQDKARGPDLKNRAGK